MNVFKLLFTKSLKCEGKIYEYVDKSYAKQLSFRRNLGNRKQPPAVGVA
jgi:hypothetical protein